MQTLSIGLFVQTQLGILGLMVALGCQSASENRQRAPTTVVPDVRPTPFQPQIPWTNNPTPQPSAPAGSACPSMTADFSCARACTTIQSLAQIGCGNSPALAQNEDAMYLTQFVHMAQRQAGADSAQTACVRMCETKQLPGAHSREQSRRIWFCYQLTPPTDCSALALCNATRC